jgi:hypothetical protein
MSQARAGAAALSVLSVRCLCCPQLKEWATDIASEAGVDIQSDARLLTSQIGAAPRFGLVASLFTWHNIYLDAVFTIPGAPDSLIQLELAFTSLTVRLAYRLIHAFLRCPGAARFDSQPRMVPL